MDNVIQGSKTYHEGKLIILVHSLRKGNKVLMAKVNLCQTRISQVSESYTFQFYQNTKVNQDMEKLSKLIQRIE